MNAEGDVIEHVPSKISDTLPSDLGALYDDSDDEDDSKVAQKKKSQNYLKEIAFEHPEIASYQELFWQFFFLPAVIYGGFGRLVVTSDRKTTVAHFSMA